MPVDESIEPRDPYTGTEESRDKRSCIETLGFTEDRDLLTRYRPRFILPPGSDYYTIPDLLPLGNLLKFSYLHDGDPDDIRIVGESIDERRGTTDISRIMTHGGEKFLRDYLAVFGDNGTTR